MQSQQSLVRCGVGLMGVVQVVGGDKWQVELFSQPQEVLGDTAFNFEPVVHEFAEVVVRTKNFAVLPRRFAGLVVLAQTQTCLDFT